MIRPYAEMEAILRSGGQIKAVLCPAASMRATLRSGSKLQANIRCADYIGGTPYPGPYEIRPAFTAQTVQTAGMAMIKDVTVQEIPIETVSNTAGGNTVIIG